MDKVKLFYPYQTSQGSRNKSVENLNHLTSLQNLVISSE